MLRKVCGSAFFWARVVVLVPLVPVAVMVDIIIALYRTGYLTVTVAFTLGYTMAYINYAPDDLIVVESTAVAFPARTTRLFKALEWVCGPETVWMILYCLRWMVRMEGL